MQSNNFITTLLYMLTLSTKTNTLLFFGRINVNHVFPINRDAIIIKLRIIN